MTTAPYRPRCSAFKRGGIARGAAALLLLATTSGCGQENPPAPAKRAAPTYPRVDPPRSKPEYDFAAGLRERYPDVAEFVVQFLETCLAGDYGGYRNLVSRTRAPESQQRFERVYHGLESLSIESIEPVELGSVSPPAALVTIRVRLRPEQKATLRRERERFAIIVLKEDDEWRMMPAPSRFQPEEDEPAATSAPAEPTPDYPWDQEGDG
jgi:hypothetical protein